MNVRLYAAPGGIYIIRDVFDANGRCVTCQYATVVGKSLVWHDCPEGADFVDMEPFYFV